MTSNQPGPQQTARPTAPQNPQQTPDQVFMQAQRFLAMNDTQEAHQRAALLRAHFPNQLPMLALHGLTCAATGLDEVGVRDLRAALDLTDQAIASPDTDDTVRDRLHAQRARLGAALARSLENLAQPGEADTVLDRVLATDPASGEPTLAKIDILAARGKPDVARSVLDDAPGLDEQTSAIAAGAVALARAGAGGEEHRMLAQRVKALTETVGLTASAQCDLLRRCAALFDRAGEHDEAFRAFTRAANLTRGNFDAQAHAKITQATIDAWTPQAIGKLKRPDLDASAHVFVVGAPGAGGVALGRAMTAHPELGSLGPSDLLTLLAVREAGARFTPHRPMLLEPGKLKGSQLDKLGRQYAEASRHAVAPAGRAVTVDACPLHTHLIGLASAALPGSAFVIIRRERRANTLACYFGGVRGHHPYAKDLGTTASYLRDTDRLLDHWEGVLTGMGHTVVSTTREALAADGAGETRRVLGVLGRPGANTAGPVFGREASDHPEKYARRLAPYADFFGPS